MKGIRILCVGRIKEDHFNEGIAFYQKMIRRSFPMEILKVADEPTPDKASPAMEEEIRRTEGRRLLSRIREDDHVVALCIDGKQYDSDSWEKRLRRQTETTEGWLVFVIGGSLGLSRELLARADDRISFSAMTFPHQMMRMILCGQIALALSGSRDEKGDRIAR